MKIPSDKTKLKQHRGEGHGADYIPWIMVHEFSSSGLSYIIYDWKHGRQVHLLSTVEHDLYYTLRWNDKVLDIREQFPLELEDTLSICREFGIKHPSYHGEPVHMTSDMLVDVKSVHLNHFVCSAKYSSNMSERAMEKLFVEKQYWVRKGVPYFIITRENLNSVLADNVRLVTEFYDTKDVYTDGDFLKHLISRKIIQVPMDKEILDFNRLLEENKEFIAQMRETPKLLLPQDYGIPALMDSSIPAVFQTIF